MGKKHYIMLAIVLISVVAVAGCGGEKVPPPAEPEPRLEGTEMEITSSAFQCGEAIPDKYSCHGQNVSPELAWRGVPEDTKSLALIMDDPDAPRGTYNHWVIYNIPLSSTGLAENVAGTSQLSDGTMQGKNSSGKVGYGGPCPPAGSSHRYYFTLYALDITLDLAAGVTKSQVLAAMEGHLLAQAETMGTYPD